MNPSHLDLARIASETRSRAYAPYSGYTVGAALLDEQGRVHTGTNVENVSYSATICAERSAVVKMISEGGRQIVRMAIATNDGGTPCGICLQVLSEFSPKPEEVVIETVNARGEAANFTLAELFPRAFKSNEVPRTE